ncbi:MAG: trigger factor [Candidatus Paceibacterota bacterium]|jgi:trigger factor
MKYEIKEISTIKRKAEIEVTAEDFENYYTQALAEISKGAEIPGFRKGKVPEKMVEERVKEEGVASEAAEAAVRDNWIKLVKETKIEAVSQPKIEIVKVARGNPFVFTAEFEVLPEIKLPNLREIKVKKEEIKIEEKEIEDTLNWLRQSRAKITKKEGLIESGDFVEFSFSCLSIENDPEKKDRIVVGKGHYVPGLEESLLGMKTEEEKDFETENPRDKKEKLKMHVKVDSVNKMELPEINDEWVKTLGKFTNVNSLKTDIKKGITEEKEIAQKQQRREEVIKKILEKTKFEVPQILIEREVEFMMDNIKSRVNSELQISLEQYLIQIKKTEEELMKEFEKMAEERVKGFLVLHQITKDEKIEAGEEEVSKKIEELLSQYPDKEEARKNIKMEQAKMHVEDELKREKLFKIFDC